MGAPARSLRHAAALLVALLLGASARAEEARYDAVIVGGGPGGMATALKLAKLGRKVLVVEARTRQRTRPQIVGPKPLTVSLLKDLGVEMGQEHAARFVRQGAGTLQLPSGMTPKDHDDPVGHMTLMAATHTISIAELEDGLYAAQHGHRDKVQVEERTTPVGAPRVEPSGEVVVDVQTEGGAPRTVRASYLVIADGANSPTLKGLGYEPDVYAHGRLAAAFFAKKGRNLVVKSHGVIRGGDTKATYTLTALSDEEAGLGKDDLTHLVRTRGQKVGLGGRDPYRVWTFEAKMQIAPELRPLDGKALVIGDAQTSPHPLTSMGVNKAIYDGVDAAETIHAMLERPAERKAIADKWQARATKAIAAMQRAAMPLYRQFGKITRTPPVGYQPTGLGPRR